jgi:hypothetical protein
MRSWSGALLTLLGWALVAPQATRAGCSSHYIPTLSLSIGSGIGLEMLESDAAAKPVGPDQVPGRRKPCFGEMCSGKSAIPLSPSRPEIYRIGSWAILPIVSGTSPSEHADSLHDEGEVRPIQSSCSIFHPPRRSPSHPRS